MVAVIATVVAMVVAVPEVVEAIIRRLSFVFFIFLYFSPVVNKLEQITQSDHYKEHLTTLPPYHLTTLPPYKHFDPTVLA